MAASEHELLPKVLKELREAAGLTQKELAEKVGVHRSYISMLESGVRHNPSDAVLYRIAKACGRSYEYFCSRINRVPNHQAAVREWLEGQDDPSRVQLIKMVLELDEGDVRALHPIVQRLLDRQ